MKELTSIIVIVAIIAIMIIAVYIQVQEIEIKDFRRNIKPGTPCSFYAGNERVPGVVKKCYDNGYIKVQNLYGGGIYLITKTEIYPRRFV